MTIYTTPSGTGQPQHEDDMTPDHHQSTVDWPLIAICGWLTNLLLVTAVLLAY